MPALDLKTNVKLENPKPFVEALSKLAAEILNKPLGYICVSYDFNENLAWNGTFEPAFLLTLISLDNINPDANEKYSAALFGFIGEHLKIPSGRGYITFIDPGRAYIGHQGTTFKSIFG